MESPKIKVNCNVTNCQYNQDEVCHANSLEIDPIGNCVAETPEGTSCTTFRASESYS